MCHSTPQPPLRKSLFWFWRTVHLSVYGGSKHEERLGKSHCQSFISLGVSSAVGFGTEFYRLTWQSNAFTSGRERVYVSPRKSRGRSGWRATPTRATQLLKQEWGCLFNPFVHTWTGIHLRLLPSSFHKPLLKIYDVKFVGRIFMEGRVVLSKGVPVFTMGLHHLSSLFLGGFSSPCHVQDSLVTAWAQVWRWPCPEWIPLSNRRCGETRALVNNSPHCNFKPRSPHGPSFL